MAFSPVEASTAPSGSIERGDDLELRVRSIVVDGEAFIDIREFVPSTSTYGRGVMVPMSVKKRLILALKEA